MSADEWEREVSTIAVSPTSSANRRLLLRVLGSDAVGTHPLPPTGSIVLGRAEEADIRIIDPSISRMHARLTLGPTIKIEDLGSQNGTRVGSTLLAPNHPVEVRAGQPLELGSVMIVLQPDHGGKQTRSPVQAAPVPVRAHTLEPGVVVEDEAMLALHRLIDRVAGSHISVLLLGETGVGKEVLAEAVHRRSPRASGPFVRLNCGAMPENLIESELFGYERGAFSGADRVKPGLIETADKGTLFLDEIGELSAPMQVRLLRVLESQEVQRLGAVTPRKIDLRLVSATHRDLDAAVTENKFRQDLLFRIDGMSMYIPPLRERLGELDGLCTLFLQQAAERAHRTPPTISPEARQLLHAHAWPGNVRELKHVMERACLLAGPVIDADSIQLRGQPRVAPSASTVPAAGSPAPKAAKSGDAERDSIIAALERCAGNQTLAAKELGISRGTLVARLAEYGIARPRKR